MNRKIETIPLGTHISPAHRDRLDHLKASGIQISWVVQNGIDLFYKQMVQAGVVEPLSSSDEPGQVHEGVA